MISKKQMDVAQERYDAMIPEFDDDDYDVDVCLNCGRILLGDGYIEVKHCEFAAEEDYIDCAPSDDPIYCKGD
jgi:hypothetical protein